MQKLSAVGPSRLALPPAARPPEAALPTAPRRPVDAFQPAAIPSVARAGRLGAQDGTDPVPHLTYLASAELKGRDSPSEGLDKAAAYIASFMQAHGLKGPNPQDPSGPYFQTFALAQFKDAQTRPPDAEQKSEFGRQLFERAHYCSDTLTPSDLRLLRRRWSEVCGRRDVPEIRNVDDLRNLSEVRGSVKNVIGLLEGTGPNKQEVLVVMAHYDHVGVGMNNKIYFGADDNASGTSTVMSMIPKLADAQRKGELNRSVLFFLTAAEEKGLVGAKYFVDHPIPGLELDKVAGVVNLDMVGRWDDKRLSVMDGGRSPNYFRDLLTAANAKLPVPFERLNRDIDNLKNRQDGWVFERKGEPVLMLFEGLSNPQGGGQLHRDYHQPTDTVDKILAEHGGEKLRKVRDLTVEVVKAAANRT